MAAGGCGSIAAGHLNPSLILARALIEAGHTAILFNLPDTPPAAEAAGVPFVGYGAADYPVGSLKVTMQRTAELSGPAAEGPANLHCIGQLAAPVDASARPAGGEFAWEWVDGRPLIYASCGTLQNRLEHVFRAMIQACAPLDVQTVITLGKDALAAGVALVAVPIAAEQPGIAARIAHLGAGMVVPLASLTAETLSAAVATVMSDGSYREAAQRASAAIRATDSAAEAVRLIEGTMR